MEPLLVQGLGKLWKSCSLNKGLISGLILLGKAWALFPSKVSQARFPSKVPVPQARFPRFQERVPKQGSQARFPSKVPKRF